MFSQATRSPKRVANNSTDNGHINTGRNLTSIVAPGTAFLFGCSALNYYVSVDFHPLITTGKGNKKTVVFGHLCLEIS